MKHLRLIFKRIQLNQIILLRIAKWENMFVLRRSGPAKDNKYFLGSGSLKIILYYLKSVHLVTKHDRVY